MNGARGDSWAEATSSDSEGERVLLAQGHTDGFRRRIVEAEEPSGSSPPHDSTTSPPSHEADTHVQESGVEAADASQSHRRDDGRGDDDEGHR